ncbi:MAG: hypothetical protein O7F10_03500 [Deltaproteobacteria bacterium]|nr:hypothetical protein [Deltaproteobacteria bacterium]
MREYLKAYRAVLRQPEIASEPLAPDEWLAWAEDFVDELDPLNRVAE